MLGTKAPPRIHYPIDHNPVCRNQGARILEAFPCIRRLSLPQQTTPCRLKNVSSHPYLGYNAFIDGIGCRIKTLRELPQKYPIEILDCERLYSVFLPVVGPFQRPGKNMVVSRQ
jgi:hypothetical protein